MPMSPATFGASPERPGDGEERRGSAASRGYGRRWQKARVAFLALHPVCDCDDDACHQPATEVHHRQAHRGDDRLFWDRTNWQALSAPCHSRITRREGPRRHGV